MQDLRWGPMGGVVQDPEAGDEADSSDALQQCEMSEILKFKILKSEF